MCVIYFFAGVSKLQGEAWWSGEAMWRAFANLEYQSTDMTWLAWHPHLLNLMTHISVLWEVSFAFLIWRPRLRPLMLVGGVALHLGIGACLGMWTFGLIMLVGCASFLPTETVGQVVARLFQRPRAGVVPSGQRSGPRAFHDRAARNGELVPVLTADDERMTGRNSPPLRVDPERFPG